MYISTGSLLYQLKCNIKDIKIEYFLMSINTGNCFIPKMLKIKKLYKLKYVEDENEVYLAIAYSTTGL